VEPSKHVFRCFPEAASNNTEKKNMCAALPLQVNSIQSPVVQQADVPKPVIEFPEFLHELHAMFKMGSRSKILLANDWHQKNIIIRINKGYF
jgi:hypothetical protein